MKRPLYFLLLFFILSISSALAQTVTLTFTAKDAGNHYVQLNRVAITNLTKSWQEIIYWPDTTLTMQNGTGIEEHVTNEGFALSQNNPNPFYGTTDVSLTVANEGLVTLEISDVNGKILKTYNVHPQHGTHQFRVSLSTPGTYVMTARQNGKSSSIKMVCNGGGTSNSIDYLGMVHTITYVLKSSTTNPFNFGDMMEYVGYATINGTEMESQRITQAQGTSQTFVLLFDVTQNHLPVLTTHVVNNITSSSATVGGIVTADGGAAVFDRGICYSTVPTPTVSDNCVHIGQGTGAFSDNLTGLFPNTTYYVRAYAMNSVGTAYGNEVNFTTTTAIQLPTVITTAVNNVTQTTATCGGNVTSDGGATVTVRGVCWSTSQNPTTADSHTSDGSGTGSFSSSLTGLTANTAYYVRAYATNIAGTTYGNEVSFTTTASAQVPSVTTAAVSNVTETSATCGGNVTSDGGATVTARGVCWSTSQNPTTADSHTSDGSGTGSYTSSLTGLTSSTTYYVRAYATNSAGTSYGNEVSFTTTASAQVPSVTTAAVSNVTETSATCGGNVTLDGGATVTARGVCWSTSQNPTTADSHTSDGSGTGSFTSSLTGLTASTTYYVRAYATNSAGTTYGNEVSFTTTASAQLPSVTTTAANNVTETSATCGGNVTTDGGATVTARGVCWSTSQSPTVNDSHTADGSGTGSFTSSITGLLANTTYYVRAYATNSVGTTYGNEVSFTTTASAQLPSVTTTAANNVTETSATCGGNVTTDGGATVTARGVCWSTSQSPTVNDSHTTDGSGTGSFTSNLTGLTAGTTYYVRAYATNSAGTTYGNEVNFTTITSGTTQDGQPCPGMPTLTDIDGNIYNTVQLGNQCWMADNLRTTRYADNTIISQGSSASTTEAYWYYPNNDASNMPTYGLLYNWKAVMHNASSSSANPSGVQGICPTGWHVPSDTEWVQLTTYVSSQSQYVCGNDNTQIAKALASTTGWNSSSGICDVGNTPSNNNATNFNAPPAGVRTYSFFDMGRSVNFWKSTEYNSNNAYSIGIALNVANIVNSNNPKTYGFSVRCVRDESGSTTTQMPTVTTSAASNITANSATCGGNVTTDGGATVTARGVCWSTSQSPTVNDSHTTDGSGTGSFTGNLTGLTANTTYFVRAYATNSVGTAYGNEVSFTTLSSGGTSQDGQPCPGTPTVTDIDNNTYNTVKIGNQCWMKENLRTTRYANGTSIALGSSTSYTTAYRYYPDDNSSNVATYGYLYNGKAVMGNSSSSSANPSGVQGICPTGWHVPSDAEWTQLTNYVSSQFQYQYACGGDNTFIAKSLASTTGWNNSTNTCAVGNNQSSNNATGFSAFPAGVFTSSFTSSTFGYFATFWSATDYMEDDAYSRSLCYENAFVSGFFDYGNYGLSVRCLCDENGSTTTQLPTVTTSAISNITANSATCGGDVTSDGGATITARGVCWGTNHHPNISNSHTTNGDGTGNFTSNLTGLTVGTTYYVQAYATNSAGTAYGNEVSFVTTSGPCPGTETVTDIDNNTYNTVKIGNQCWMKENLRTTRYANGTSIALGSSTSTTTAFRYYPNNNSSNVFTYGYLYNWKAVMDNSSSSSVNPSGVQGICPTGWHVPSNAEWLQLTGYVGNQSQYECHSDYFSDFAKALASTTGWSSSSNTCEVGNNPSTNNATGFSALPAGSRNSNSYNDYDGFGNYTRFWSATEAYDDFVYNFRLCYNCSGWFLNTHDKDYGFSVRCLRNEGGSTTAQLPTVTTSAASNITANSATCGGNVTSDGGAGITARGVCWSTSHNPTVSNSHTSDGSSTGSFTSGITGLTANTTYYVRAYATNSAGTAYGSEVSFITLSNGGSSQDGQPCPGMPTLTDIDGNIYNTVQLGNQCWMAENLRTTRYADNTIISQGSSSSSTEAYWYYPNNDASNKPTYGLLYNWKAAIRNASSSSANPSGVQGICPTGWHLPTDAEWTQLADYVSSQNQYVCGNDNTQIAKALASTTGWNSSSGICDVGYTPSDNNATNFNAPPAGVRTYSFFDKGRSVNFWKSTEYNSNNAYSIGIALNVANIVNSNNPKTYGFSVRCVLDESGSTTTQMPTVTTSAASNITENAATCGGNATSDGGATVTARGVCWSTTHNPTVSNSHTSDGSGTGSFTSNLTGLTAGTTYYVRAYATNSVGTAYGNEVSFTTLPTQTQDATIILEAHDVWGDGSGYQLLLDADATAYGTIIPAIGPLTSSGDADATTYAAFEYKIPQNADGSTYTSNMVYDGSVTLSIPAGTYDFCITNPTPGDRIWIAASDNGRKDNFIFQEGYSYHFFLSKNMDNTHDTVSITIFNSSLSTPTVTTTVASNVSSNSATCGGNIISDGGATVTVRGVCWSISHNPTLSNNHTSNGSGTGSFTSSLTGLTASTTYYVRAYATNSVGTTYGNEVSFTTLSSGGTSQDGQPCLGTATLTDYDGNVYNTVQLGNQCWMKENLKTTKYADGTSISQGSSTSSSDVTGYWYYPNNDASNKPTYGLLYNWKAVMGNSSSSSTNPSGVQGICPTGWHVPSYTEWTQLSDYVSSQSQWVCGNSNSYIAKALAGTTGWDSSTNTCAVGNTPSNNNATGFSALPAGNNIDYFGYCAYFWSATQNDSSDAVNRYLYYSSANISSYGYYKSTGYSVRCVRNGGGSSTAQLPTVTTSAASNITANSATCGGWITSDGGSTVTSCGVCWSTSQNPTVSDSHTSDGSGIGGSSGTGIFTSNLTGLTANTTYYVRAYATNSAGTAYGSEVSFTTFNTPQDGQPCPGTATLTDYDGNVYNTVQIGNQCWMKENLRTTHYDDGQSIPSAVWVGDICHISYWDYDVALFPIPLTRRGYLYNWNIVMRNASSSNSTPSGVQGICPLGWHVPSRTEWNQLTTYVSSQSQYVCGSDINYIAKALASQTDWISFSGSCFPGDQSVDTNNATGFSAVPAACEMGPYNDAGRIAYFWTSTKLNNLNSYYFTLCNQEAYVHFGNTRNTDGLPVRCLKD